MSAKQHTKKADIKTVDLDSWEEIPCSCGRSASAATLQYKEYRVRGWKCECGEQYIHPQDSLKISFIEKLKHEKIEVKVGKLGASLVIRIPKQLEDLYKIKQGEKIELVPEDLQTISIEV